MMHEEDDDQSVSRNTRLLEAKSVDVAELDGSKEETVKLCGYLNKLAGKGPLRGFKTRWFVYDPRKCYLYYFKSPQDALPLGHIEIADACFSYDVEGEEGQFEIRSAGKEFLLKAPNKQVMQYWLQQLQQKRWDFCKTRGAGTVRDSWSSPTTLHPLTGLVAKDAGPTNATMFEKPCDSMESVRSDFAVETDTNGMVGIQSARQPTAPLTPALNSLRNWGSELRNSMSHLRGGRSSENRRSVFYTASNEDWEMLDHPGKDMAEAKPPTEPSRRGSPSHLHRHSIGSAFTFDFGRSAGRAKRPFLRDGILGSVLSSRSAESSPVECNGNKNAEQQMRLHNQQEEISRMQEEQTRLKEELAGHKELVRLLQQTLRSTQCERRPAAPVTSGASGDPGQPQAQTQTEALLMEREGQIQALCGHMERLALEKESLQLELRTLKVKVGEMNEQMGMLMETIQAKDEVIIKLSQDGADDNVAVSDAGSPPAAIKEQQELNTLKDSLDGYKAQNNFLNKEILELTVLRRNAESREKALEAKYTALEAKLCQLESKYLVLLQEVKTPVGSTSEVITRLLEDALQVDCTEQQEHALLKPHTISEYDVFGFKTMPEEEEDEREKLRAKAVAVDLKTLSLTDQEVSISVKWDNYLAGALQRDMVRSPELKALVRSGVPHVHRARVWRWAVWQHTRKLRECLAPDYYRGLLSQARERQNPAAKQIELDLLRTLPNNKHYASPSSDGIHKLRNVLLAFSWRNPDIGYCQGLNRLAAIALLYLEEEDSFWCLTAIVEVFMPRDYYTKTLLGSQVDQRVFKDLMSEKMPRLHAHFEHYKVDFSLITFNWFLVVFVDSLVSDILFKIWDAFLYEGPKIIFRFALAVFKYEEEEFLKHQDSMAIFKHLRCFTRSIVDARKLMSIAFVDMNPFPLRQIQNRRAFHLEKVRLELTELEAIRQTFLRERENSQQGRHVISDDEEDN